MSSGETSSSDLSDEVRALLARAQDGDARAADALLPIVYSELRGMASHLLGRRGGLTLQPTALIHEAYLKLVRDEEKNWESRAHFFRAAAMAMRQVLVDHVRARRTEKRGGRIERVPLDGVIALHEEHAADLLALDEALTRLAEHDEELARVVELRFFGGLTLEETASVLGMSRQMVERRWRTARLWLHGQLDESE